MMNYWEPYGTMKKKEGKYVWGASKGEQRFYSIWNYAHGKNQMDPIQMSLKCNEKI
jgi:hypothetical protein